MHFFLLDLFLEGGKQQNLQFDVICESQYKETEVWSEVLSIYTQIFSPKKIGFSEKKNSSQKKKIFFLPFFYATFQCGRYNVFKKKKLVFFAHKKLKKPPSKVAHNRPKPFIPQPSPTHSQQPKIDFSYHKKCPTKRLFSCLCLKY